MDKQKRILNYLKELLFSSKKKNKSLIHRVTGVNPKIFMLGERNQAKKITSSTIPWYEIPENGAIVE